MKKSKRTIEMPKLLLANALFLVILLSNSCINPSASNHPSTAHSSLKSKVKLSEHPIDTSRQWKLTSMVRSILEDSQGNVWFGSDYEGVCRYDGKLFTYFTMKDGLKHNQVRTIQEDQDGNIWFATGDGVSKYDGEKFSFQTARGYLTPSLGAKSTWKKEANDLWFNGEVEGGIYRYDGQSLSVLEFPILEPEHESFSITGTVTGICEGKNNMLWMANYGGVIGYDGQAFKFINQKGVAYHVRSLLEDSKGNLWIGNNGIGVLRYDGDATINFTEKYGVNDKNELRGGALAPPGTLNHVFTIAEDHKGNIWFGDRDTGAWRFDGEKLINYTSKDGLTNRFVRVIYKDKKNGLWFGLEGGSVCKFNGTSFDKVF